LSVFEQVGKSLCSALQGSKKPT